MLQASDQPLADRYDLVMFDLDGVIYIDGHAIDGAPEAVAALRASGDAVAFVTNNASRTPAKVAERMTTMGIPTEASDVVTSAQAAARLLRDQYGDAARIWVLGAGGLREAVASEGLEVVDGDGDPVALVTGYGPDVKWAEIMRAAVAVRGGLGWVASNSDLTIPTGYGVAPGHGVQVRMLADFTGVTPQIAGKPEGPLLRETIERVGGERPLMVGDRLDTDIEGAQRSGLDSLLVLTGVTGLTELVAAEPHRRPTYLSSRLHGLAHPQPATTRDGDRWRCGGCSAEIQDGRLTVEGDGDPDDWWRAAASAAWAHLDQTGQVADTSETVPPRV